MASNAQASGRRQLKSKPRAWVFWLGMVVVTAFVCLGSAEIMLRLLLPSTTIRLMGGEHFLWYAGYKTYFPNTHFTMTNEPGESFEVSIDETGLRNPAQSLARADVMLLGDSMIAGLNTPAEHTLVGELRAAGIASYNAGVDGAGTFDEVHLLRDHLHGWRGHIVVVAFYLGNDFRDNYGDQLVPESSTAPALRPVHGRMDEGLRAACKALFTCKWLYYEVYLGLIEGELLDPMKSYALAEMEMLAKGGSAASDIAVAHTRQAFTELARIAALQGFTVLVVGVPSQAQVLQRIREVQGFEADPRAFDYGAALIGDRGLDFDRPDRLTASLASEAGFSYVSLLPIFRAHQEEKLFYQIDLHWSAAGEKLAAETLVPHLQSMLKTQAASH
jgi:hypothetical protein